MKQDSSPRFRNNKSTGSKTNDNKKSSYPKREHDSKDGERRSEYPKKEHSSYKDRDEKRTSYPKREHDSKDGERRSEYPKKEHSSYKDRDEKRTSYPKREHDSKDGERRSEYPKKEHSSYKDRDEKRTSYPKREHDTRDGDKHSTYVRKSRSFDEVENEEKVPYQKRKSGLRLGKSKAEPEKTSKDRFSHSKPSYSRDGFKPRSHSASKSKTNESPKSGLIRLNKYIANSGICSRREADTFISAGVVKVNDKIVTELGYKVQPYDKVEFEGQVIKNEAKVYVILNKPKDVISASSDEEGHMTVVDIVKNCCPERLYPVGRLDKATTGVLLLTNDGDLTKKLTHPSSNIKKIYQVSLDKALTKSDMDKLAEGIVLEDGEIHADEIAYVDADDKKKIGIELHSGRNRIVRRMFEHMGYSVKKLDRVYFAGLTKKNITRGRWRFLSEQEINFLKML